MVNTAILEVLEEKMPESPWHNKMVETVKEPLEEALHLHPTAVVFRDLFFEFRGKRYAPDLATVLQGAPPIETIGLVYHVPEDGPAPDAIVEVAVSAKALGEAVAEKADFYSEMGVKDYLIVEAFPSRSICLWMCHPASGERPKSVSEAVIESLGIVVRAEGQKVRMFDREGNEILSLREALALERAKREELEQKVAELERRLQERGL